MSSVSHRSTSFRHFKGMSLRDHYFEVPLDYADPDAGTLEVFAREVVASGKRDDEDLPWMVFFQGGPGFGANRQLSGRPSVCVRNSQLLKSIQISG